MKISQFVIRSLCLLSLWLGLGLQAHAQTDTVTYVYTDPQGTPLVKADASGNVIARYDYTPYGNSIASLGAAPNGPGYTGHVNDPETGLVYMQARYYQPTGRLLSPDPIGPTPGNVYSFNRYAYANNNPVIYSDSTGMFSDHLSGSQIVCEIYNGNGCGTSGGGGTFNGAGASGTWEKQGSSSGQGTGNTSFSPSNSSPFDSGSSNGGVVGSLATDKNADEWATGGVEVTGAVSVAPSIWSAGLNGGENSVFWSGYAQGARGIAEGLGGTTLELTPIGRTLDYLSNSVGIPGLGPVWNAASATFARNATGTATAVILSEGTTWSTIELPILTARAIPIVFFVP